MIRAHRDREADLTIGCIPVPLDEGDHFGIMQTDGRRPRGRASWRSRRPPRRCPATRTTRSGRWASTSSTTRLLFELLCQDAAKTGSDHDFGKNIIPHDDRRAAAGVRLPVPRREPQGGPVLARRGHARRLLPGEHGPDRGRPGAEPVRRDWPIRTLQPQLPPPKFVFTGEGAAGHARRGEALDSIVCPGSIVSRRARAAQHPLAAGAGEQLRGGRGFDPVRRRGRGPVLPGPAGDHRQGREAAAVHGDRVRRRVRPPTRASP